MSSTGRTSSRPSRASQSRPRLHQRHDALLRRGGRTRIVDRRLAFLALVVAPVVAEPAATAAEPVIIVVVLLLLLALRTIAPVPELRLRRQQKGEADARRHDGHKCSGFAHEIKLPIAVTPRSTPLPPVPVTGTPAASLTT